LLSALAERSPAPGGGSAAAWCGALAAALLEMTARFAGADDAARRAPALRAQLLTAGEADLESYEPVIAAIRLDADDPARAGQLEHALSTASEPPLAIARAAAEVAELAASVAAGSTRTISGDAVAGVVLADAATRAAAHLVEINLHGRSDDPRLDEAAELTARTATLRAQALAE
jgi:formiminotetrahydrofolate cyclodeaminase